MSCYLINIASGKYDISKLNKIMKLSLLVPVYNEEQTIDTILEKLIKVKLPCTKEIIIVDDASTDRTSNKIHKRLKLRNFQKIVKYFKHRQNKGKGGAIQTGVKYATGQYILIQDADLEYDPGDICKLLPPIFIAGKKKNKIAVYGSRFMKKNIMISPLYLFGNKLLTFVTNLFCGVKISDMETGYKLLPATFLKAINIQSRHFDIEPEITVKLIKMGIPIVEVPISYRGRTHLAGKKLTVLDAYEAIKALFYFRFIDNN